MSGKILHEKIKSRREEIDFTQQTVADLSGISLGLYKAIEQGKSGTSKKNIQSIAKAINLPVEDIYIEGFRDTKVITIASNKGGSGKTSTAQNLAFALSQIDDTKVLMVDGDMQMNLTRAFDMERNMDSSLYNAILHETPLENYIIATKVESENLDMIISDFKLSSIDMELFNKKLRETLFKRLLAPILEKGLYDYIIIDTSPYLGMLTYNLLVASHYCLIPVELSAFGIDGLEPMNDFIQDVRIINKDLELLGVLKTKVDLRENITKEAGDTLSSIYGDKIFETYIPTDTNIKRSQWEATPLNEYKADTRANKAYISLAKEVMKLVK